MKKLLTIAIPTYNRAPYLDLCLRQICPQADRFRNEVDILVANNCSTDATEQLALSYTDRYDNVIYVKHDKNIGADRNLAYCFNEADSRYVVLFGDDDVLMDGALDYLLQILRQGNHGVVFMHGYSFVNDHLAEMPTELGGDFIVIANPVDFIERVNVNLTFISSNVINKSLVPANTDLLEFAGTNLVQLGWIMPALLNAPTNVYIARFMLGGKAFNSGNIRFFKVFGENLHRIMGRFVGGRFDRKQFLRFSNLLLREFYPQRLMTIREGKEVYDPENVFATLAGVFGSYPQFWLFTAPLTLMPYRLARRYRTLSISLSRGLLNCMKRFGLLKP